MLKALLAKSWNAVTHVWGRVSGHYYFEDFIRVYPDGLAYNRLGLRRMVSPQEQSNFLNHRKFYLFAAQFVGGRTVADIGCGSGYGCAMLKEAGATRVCGADVSKHAIAFAERRYGSLAEFSLQSITDLKRFADQSFDVVISSEVLEHIKEYHKEDAAVAEVKRITRPGGIVVFGTPNSELLGDHGFSFDEMNALMGRHFSTYGIFENALLPYGPGRQLWERRQAEGRTGITVAQSISLSETVLPNGVKGEVKKGIPAGTHPVGPLKVDTTLLHNTHSWVVVAVKQ